MKKNYTLFLKWILTLGLLFSIGLTGCDNVTGENGAPGADYDHLLQIYRVGVDPDPGVVARGDTAVFGVTYNAADVPDPASVSWRVWGDNDWSGVSTVETGPAAASDGRTVYRTTLKVPMRETSTILYIEAAYKGYIAQKTVLVGLPFNKITLEPGVSEIGTSQITRYDWVGREGRDGETLGQHNEASTYLVYARGSEPVRNLLAGAPMLPLEGTYHVYDSISVKAGDWITVYEVSAVDTARIISYGSDQAYIYARNSDDVGKIPLDGTAVTKLYTNILLPDFDGFPTVSGYWPGSGSGAAHVVGKGSDEDGGVPIPSPKNNGVARAKINTDGSKEITGYTVALVHESILFKDYDPELQVPKVVGGDLLKGGYDLKAWPSEGGSVTDLKTPQPDGILLTQKLGNHRYAIQHEGSLAWRFWDGAFSTSTPETNKGIAADQGDVTIQTLPTVPTTFRDGANILSITTTDAAQFFVKDLTWTNSSTTPKSISTATITSKWFVERDSASPNYRYVKKYAVTDTGDGPTGVDLLLDSVINGGSTPSGSITIKGDAFGYGSKPAPDNGYGLIGNSPWSFQRYAAIDLKINDSTTTSTPLDGLTDRRLESGKNNIVTITAGTTSPGLVPNPSPPPTTPEPFGDQIRIKWYWVNGNVWGDQIPTKTGASSGDNSYNLTVGSQWNGSSSNNYASTFTPYYSGTTHVGIYGNTVGVIVENINPTAGQDVRFINSTTGEKVLNQFVVGVIR